MPRAAGSTVTPTRIFRVEEICEADRVMEAGEGRGKMVVVHS
jgi:NADPH:quinone reductase